jgi:hypothetical protein
MSHANGMTDNWSWFAMAQYVTYNLGNYPSKPQTPDEIDNPPAPVAEGASFQGFVDELAGADPSTVDLPW